MSEEIDKGKAPGKGELSLKPAAQLATKLSRIIGKATYVQKTGRNQFHNYNYATEADFLALVKPLLAEERLAIIPRLAGPIERIEGEPTQRGKKQWITNITLSFDIIDGDTGYRETVPFPGCGIDGEDKGLYKAITGSVKYFVAKLFLIETGDDPEKDNESGTQQQGSTTTPPPQAKKTAPPANNAPAEGKAEPRPGEKKPTLEEATQAALAEGDKKREEQKAAKTEKKEGEPQAEVRLLKKEELNDFLDQVKPVREALGGVGSDYSKKLSTTLLKAAGVGSSKDFTTAHKTTILAILEAYELPEGKGYNVEGLKKWIDKSTTEGGN